MPGLITHQRIFFESVKSLKIQKHPNYVTHLLDVQCANPSFISSALTGLLVPNLFDYLPGRNEIFFGNPITYYLHSDEGVSFIHYMFSTILENSTGEPNEWSLCQKGFFYGYVSHWVVDAIFHPFVFYWSGFPTYKDNRTTFYRKQHLLFEYTIDQYIAYFFNAEPFEYNLMLMIPPKDSIQYQSIKTLFMEFFSKHNVTPNINIHLLHNISYDTFDIAMKFIKPVYALKKTHKPYIIKIIRFIADRLYSDFFVRYPDAKRINRHILNLHRERWFIPTGEPGLHYESVDDLFKIAKQKTVAIWQQFEELFFCRTKVTLQQCISVLEYANAYTGKKGFSLDRLTLQNPVRLRN